ncbi:MAG: TrmH family RNA methyltransferase [Candidatus Zixiibacteriota bacterium]
MPLSRKEVKNVSVLKTRKGRREQRRFAAEGVRLLEESLRFRSPPETVYHAPSLLSDRGHTLIGRLGRYARIVQVSSRELAQLSGTMSPQGVVAVFGLPKTGLSELYRRTCRRLLVCENISDPGNMGTLIRSARAFGFTFVSLCGCCVEPYSPKVVRASAGAVFGCRVAIASTVELLQLTDLENIMVIAADGNSRNTKLPGASTVRQKKVALAIGSEAKGLSEALRAGAYATVRVAHHSAVESLNAAVAGSILMKQIYDMND